VFTARYVLHSTFCPHSVFVCFVWIWEHTAIISLFSIDWLVFITETECVYCAVRSTFCPHSVFMCFVWIWEQTAIISLYSIDWLVFIIETECVYCAVRYTFYVLPTLYLCGSENKERLFHCTALTGGFFITETECVYCAVRAEIISTVQVHLGFQGYYSFIPDFLCFWTSRTLEWTPTNIEFNVPLLQATCAIPIQII